MGLTFWGRLAQLSPLNHAILMLAVVFFLGFVLVIVVGDDWNKPDDDYDNWDNGRVKYGNVSGWRISPR